MVNLGQSEAVLGNLARDSLFVFCDTDFKLFGGACGCGLLFDFSVAVICLIFRSLVSLSMELFG